MDRDRWARLDVEGAVSAAAMMAHYDAPVLVDWQPAPEPPSVVAVRDLLASGPMTIRKLAKLTGYTPRTIRYAIARLGYRVGGPIGGQRKVSP